MKFKNINQYTSFFTDLISKEREAEIEFHLSEINLLSGRQREKKGRAILLLNGSDAGHGIGGTYLVKLNRAQGLPDTEISNGDVVVVSKEKPNEKDAFATVVSKGKRSITIAYEKTPPFNCYEKNLRLDLFSNDITFQRMESALSELENLLNQQKILLSKIEINQDVINKDNYDNHEPKLNKSQIEALKGALLSDQLFLIQGPPGTGKTTTLSSIISAHVNNGKKVLACAPSNTAVDNLLEKLNTMGIKSLRIGNPVRVSDNLLSNSLDVQLQEHPDYQQANAYWNKIQLLQREQQEYIPATGQNRRGLKDDAILRQAKQKKAYRGIPNAKIRKMAKWIQLQRQVNELYQEAEKYQNKAIEELINNASVIFATNSSAGSSLLNDIIFDVVCIDEATQATEPETLIPLIKGKKWILAGDHKQLPPTVKSPLAQALKISLFERLISFQPKEISHMLSIQYRMSKNIMAFSNEQFYKNKLKAHPNNATHTLEDLTSFFPYPVHQDTSSTVLDPKRSIHFINVAEGKEERVGESFSYYNSAEIEMVQKVADNLLGSRLFPEDIGIISPYDQQVGKIKRKLKDYGIEIKSIDGFQGREKEVIILSLVRANNKGKIGFLKDYRRLNVAITRAKRKLIVIGNERTLESDPLYASFLQLIFTL